MRVTDPLSCTAGLAFADGRPVNDVRVADATGEATGRPVNDVHVADTTPEATGRPVNDVRVTIGELDSDGLLATGAAAGSSADQPSADSDAEVTDSVPGTTVALVGAGVDIPLPPDRQPHVPDPSPAFEPGADRCIFRVEGTLDAVFVSGCASRPERRSSTWILPSSGNVNRSCDAFNHWAERTIASDANASRLAYLRADGGAGLELAAPSLRFSTEALGFYDALATSRADQYSRGSRVSRTLSGSSTVEQVLCQLLADLSALGLIDVAAAW